MLAIYAGDNFGKWTVLDSEPVRLRHHLYWRCRCECGTVLDVSGWNLTHGFSTGCKDRRQCRDKVQDNKFREVAALLEETAKKVRGLCTK